MELTFAIGLDVFADGLKRNDGLLYLELENLLYAENSNCDYGLSLLRDAVAGYEQQNGIASEDSKRQIPFFRDNRRLLIGPEVGLFALRLYGNREAIPFSRETELLVTVDSYKLGDFCLDENLYLLQCKYDEQRSRKQFMEKIALEYGNIHFDGEHFGFIPGTQFFSMLYTACLEICPPDWAKQEEWRLCAFRSPSDAEFVRRMGTLRSVSTVGLPFGCIVSLSYDTASSQYSLLADLLERYGLDPYRYLEGLKE